MGHAIVKILFFGLDDEHFCLAAEQVVEYALESIGDFERIFNFELGFGDLDDFKDHLGNQDFAAGGFTVEADVGQDTIDPKPPIGKSIERPNLVRQVQLTASEAVAKFDRQVFRINFEVKDATECVGLLRIEQ